MAMMVWHALRNVDLHEIPERARALEALGYDFITTPESKHDPFLPLTLVAEHTKRLRFGTSVAIAFPRAPYLTANLSWDLARYSGGRFVLGLGTQVKVGGRPARGCATTSAASARSGTAGSTGPRPISRGSITGTRSRIRTSTPARSSTPTCRS